MDTNYTAVKDVTPAMAKYMQEHEPQKYQEYINILKGIDNVRVELCDMSNRNAREAVVNRIVLAIADAILADESIVSNIDLDDVSNLRSCATIIETSSFKKSILGHD